MRAGPVGFLSVYDVNDLKAWSGAVHSMYCAVSRDFDVFPVTFTKAEKKLWSVLLRLSNNKHISGNLIRLFLQKRFNAAVKNGISVFFVPAGSDILGTLTIPEKIRIIYYSDATSHLMQNYVFHDSRKNALIAHTRERKAIKRADRIMYASRWAKDDAVSFYGADPAKITVSPFFSNLRDEYTEKSLKPDVFNLLIAGLDWKGKGIDIAIEAVSILNQRHSDRKYSLTVMGFDRPRGFDNEAVSFTGYLDKGREDEAVRLLSCYKNADVFILPTKAEAAGLVYCEAAMYGVPVTAYATGGYADYIINGYNGITVKEGSPAESFADAAEIILDPAVYPVYSKNARTLYERRLNSSAWSDDFFNVWKQLQ